MIARCTSRNCSIYCLLRTLANRKPNMYIMWKNTLYKLIVHIHLSNWTQIFVVTEQLLPDDAILACVLQLKPMSLVGGILLFVIPSPCTRSTRCQLVCMHKAQTRGFAKESDKHPQSHYIRRSVLQMQILQKITRLLPNHEQKHTCQDMTWIWQTSTNHYIKRFVLLIKLLPKPWAQTYMSGKQCWSMHFPTGSCCNRTINLRCGNCNPTESEQRLAWLGEASLHW